jgi:hypothetical protein
MKRFFSGRYIPKGAVKVADKKSDAVAYLSTNKDGKPVAVIYFGKQSTPVAHYRYHNEARRELAVKEAFANRQAKLASKMTAAKEKKAWVCDYKVGEILGTCWGYDQTNREYYEVVEVHGKHVIIRELCQERTETGWAQGNCVPLPGKYLTPRYDGDKQGKPMRKLAQPNGVRISSCQWASRETPKMVGGVPVYSPSSWSAYA